jgi:hypothetical protein
LPSQSPVAADQLDEATRFRQDFGLVDTEAWINEVAADPRASSEEFGTPLMPFELMELQSRALNADAVIPVVQAYGALHGEVFGGTYIDHDSGGHVVALFTDDLSDHEAALASELHPDAEILVRACRYSIESLEDLHERVLIDRERIEALGVTVGSIGVSVPENVLLVGLSGPDPSAAGDVAALVGAGRMVRFWWDQSAELPRGSLRGRVVDQDGQPAPGLELRFVPDSGDFEPDGGTAFGTSPNGEFEIPRIAALGWRIDVVQIIDGTEQRVVGSEHVRVVANKDTVLEIHVVLVR